MGANPISFMLVAGEFALEELNGIRVSSSGYIVRATAQSVYESDQSGGPSQPSR